MRPDDWKKVNASGFARTGGLRIKTIHANYY
jgi:hypothetical protein